MVWGASGGLGCVSGGLWVWGVFLVVWGCFWWSYIHICIVVFLVVLGVSDSTGGVSGGLGDASGGPAIVPPQPGHPHS